jgi:N-acyl-D-aspartate/D-glutamate deacylase
MDGRGGPLVDRGARDHPRRECAQRCVLDVILAATSLVRGDCEVLHRRYHHTVTDPHAPVVIRGGLVFDGRGSPARVADVLVRDGIVSEIAARISVPGARVIDAQDRWVVPGFIDLHTHYDAEVEVAPGLSESVRHGVTTVVLGSCSLSMALGTPDDLADMFCRVEAIPDRIVRPILRARKAWNTHHEYLAHLDALALGPNVAAFAGHSAIRAAVLGTERSVDESVKPTSDELARVDAHVNEALDAGCLGASIQTLPWDKMGGSKHYRSRPLPSTFATWREYRRIARILRARSAVLQGVPNVSTKVNVLLFLLESAGLFFRKTLKTTVISMMEPVSDRGIHKLAGTLSRWANRFLRADFKWQALPNVFDLWADGVDLVVFEEFGAGTAALHLEDALARANLLKDETYRAWFKKQWTSRWLPRAFHRDLARSKVLACPDAAVVGKSFTEVAHARGVDATDAFLDLVAEHGDALRWYTVMCNERTRSVEWIVSHDDVLIGFSDAGAHLRQMAHYNFPLRMLKLVQAAQNDGRAFMTAERAVHRLTGEIAEWLGIDAGVLDVGKRADIAIVNPAHFDAKLDDVDYAPIEGFGADYLRLVRRNDDAVDAVLIAGNVVVERGTPTPMLGRAKCGRVLKRLSHS